MNPGTRADGDARNASEPSKVGKGRKADGGATAPTHSAEQALQDEWVSFSTFAEGVCVSDVALSALLPWAP
jgi:hypothetical protein